MSHPPSISVQLAVNPPRFIPGSKPAPTISATATSHATQPITIFTWGDLFNLRLAQKRENLTCLDLTTNTPIRMDVTKGPRRTAISRVLWSSDDCDFHTLKPGKPVTFTAPFKFGYCDPDNPSTAWPAHKYRLGVNEELGVSWWRYGKKWRVLALPWKTKGLGKPSGPEIKFKPVAPVDFEIIAPSTR